MATWPVYVDDHNSIKVCYISIIKECLLVFNTFYTEVNKLVVGTDIELGMQARTWQKTVFSYF
jgi:hypothetical protein